MAFSQNCRRWIACKTRKRPKFSYISRGNGSFCGCFTHGSLIIHVCIPYNSRMKCAWVTNETRVWRMKYGRNAHDSLMNSVWFTHRTRMIHLWNANIMDIYMLPKTCMYYKLQWENLDCLRINDMIKYAFHIIDISGGDSSFKGNILCGLDPHLLAY